MNYIFISGKSAGTLEHVFNVKVKKKHLTYNSIETFLDSVGDIPQNVFRIIMTDDVLDTSFERQQEQLTTLFKIVVTRFSSTSLIVLTASEPLYHFGVQENYSPNILVFYSYAPKTPLLYDLMMEKLTTLKKVKPKFVANKMNKEAQEKSETFKEKTVEVLDQKTSSFSDKFSLFRRKEEPRVQAREQEQSASANQTSDVSPSTTVEVYEEEKHQLFEPIGVSLPQENTEEIKSIPSKINLGIQGETTKIEWGEDTEEIEEEAEEEESTAKIETAHFEPIPSTFEIKIPTELHTPIEPFESIGDGGSFLKIEENQKQTASENTEEPHNLNLEVVPSISMLNRSKFSIITSTGEEKVDHKQEPAMEEGDSLESQFQRGIEQQQEILRKKQKEMLEQERVALKEQEDRRELERLEEVRRVQEEKEKEEREERERISAEQEEKDRLEQLRVEKEEREREEQEEKEREQQEIKRIEKEEEEKRIEAEIKRIEKEKAEADRLVLELKEKADQEELLLIQKKKEQQLKVEEEERLVAEQKMIAAEAEEKRRKEEAALQEKEELSLKLNSEREQHLKEQEELRKEKEEIEGLVEQQKKEFERELLRIREEEKQELLKGQQRLKEEQEENDRKAEELRQLESSLKQEATKVHEVKVAIDQAVKDGNRREGKVLKRPPSLNSKINTYTKIYIVTGDRHSEVTKSSLNIAKKLADSKDVLYVDLDVERKGSLVWLGLEKVLPELNELQSKSLKHLKNVSVLEHLVYFYDTGNFSTLLTNYGEEITDEEVDAVQRVLALQDIFSTLVIDCPLSKLHLLEELIPYSSVLINIVPSLRSNIATISELSNVLSNVHTTTATNLYRNSAYLLTGNGDLEAFNKDMEYIRRIFAMQTEEYDWTSLPVIGTSKNFRGIYDKL